jgi:hypothetical protein
VPGLIAAHHALLCIRGFDKGVSLFKAATPTKLGAAGNYFDLDRGVEQLLAIYGEVAARG